MKFCNKCQSETRRYADGKCVPCTLARVSAYRAANLDKVRACSAASRAANREHKCAANKAYYDANKSRLLASNKAWKTANPEKVKAASKAWDAKNAEKRVSAKKTWGDANKDKVRGYYRKYREANPEACKAARHRRRARLRNANGSHTAEDIRRLLVLQKSKCACCKSNIAEGYHVDHIQPLSKGGSNDWLNLQLLCPTCNMQKHTIHQVDFMQSKGYLL